MQEKKIRGREKESQNRKMKKSRKTRKAGEDPRRREAVALYPKNDTRKICKNKKKTAAAENMQTYLDITKGNHYNQGKFRRRGSPGPPGGRRADHSKGEKHMEKKRTEKKPEKTLGDYEEQERPTYIEAEGGTFNHVTRGGYILLSGIQDERQAHEIEDAYFQGYRRGKRDERNRISKIVEKAHYQVRKTI
jgi:hypothetical protein